MSGLQRALPTDRPMPATGSKSQKLSTSLRDWASIQVTDGSTASRANTARSCRRLGMQRRSGRDRAEREQHHGRAAPAEIGIELERPRDDGGRQRAAPAVADDHDLVDCSFAHGGDHALRTGLDRPIEATGFAARERAQIGPMAVDLDHEPAVGERPQREEERDRGKRAGNEPRRARASRNSS